MFPEIAAFATGNLTRRDWLQRGLAAAGSGASVLESTLAGAATPALPESLLGGSSFRDPADGLPQFALVKVQVSAASDRPKAAEAPPMAPQLAKSAFFPHGWALDATNPDQAFFFEKQGPGAALFDLRAMQVLATIPPSKGRSFYGHGVHVHNQHLLFSTESDGYGEGAIGVRDAKSLQYIGEFPSYGARPHDCHLVDQGRVLVVSNGGGSREAGPAPNISYIDVASQRLLHQHTMPGADFNTGHLAPLGTDRAIVTSAPRLGLGADSMGAVSWCSTQRVLRVLPVPADLVPGLLGEALSVVLVPEKDLVVVTHPTPGWLTFWSLRRQSLRARLRLERVRGVALSADRLSLWVSFGQNAAIGQVSLTTPQPSHQTVGTQSFITGSHLLNLMDAKAPT